MSAISTPTLASPLTRRLKPFHHHHLHFSWQWEDGHGGLSMLDWEPPVGCEFALGEPHPRQATANALGVDVPQRRGSIVRFVGRRLNGGTPVSASRCRASGLPSVNSPYPDDAPTFGVGDDHPSGPAAPKVCNREHSRPRTFHFERAGMPWVISTHPEAGRNVNESHQPRLDPRRDVGRPPNKRNSKDMVRD